MLARQRGLRGFGRGAPASPETMPPLASQPAKGYAATASATAMLRRKISLLLFFIAAPLQAAVTPNDPAFSQQWYLPAIHAPEAWERTTGSRDVIIAIIDSGIDIDHEDTVDNLWVNEDEIADDGIDNDKNGYIDDRNGWDFVSDVPDPSAKFHGADEVTKKPLGVHHGQLIAGLAAAVGNNGKGMAGVSWRSRIMPLRVLTGRGVGSITNVVRAIDYAINNGASVINLSFNVTLRSTLLTAALRRAYERGVVVVAAAGNDQEGTATNGTGLDTDVASTYPVCTSGPRGEDYVIGVAATNKEEKKAPFSYFGNRCVDIAAPGDEILTSNVYAPAFGFDTYYSNGWDGTSFAAGLVSGAIALLRSVDATLTPHALQQLLRAGARDITATEPVFAKRLGAGLMDVDRSLAILADPVRKRELIRAPLQGRDTTRIVLGFDDRDNRESTSLRLFTPAGEFERRIEPFGNRYRGAVNVIGGDIDHDGDEEIVAHGGLGGGPHVRVYSRDGSLRGQFFVFDSSYRGGVSVAVGDVNPDGVSEVLAINQRNASTEFRVFTEDGKKQLSFSVFGSESTEGGVVRTGDVDGDGIDDAVYATYESATPLVKVTDIFGAEKFSFRPYSEDVGPLALATADVDGDGVAEIVTARGRGVPEVRVWKEKTLVASFLAYAPSFRSGVSIAGGDVDGDGRDEIVTVPRENGGPHVRIFNGEGALEGQFFAEERSWRGGMTVAVIR